MLHQTRCSGPGVETLGDGVEDVVVWTGHAREGKVKGGIAEMSREASRESHK